MSSETTELLSLPYIMPSQAQKHVTHNEAMRKLDALVQLAVESRGFAAPPSEPVPGERHIVAADATGAWNGRDGSIAAWLDGQWLFMVPNAGWLAWVKDEGKLLVFSAPGWIDFAPAAGAAYMLGINTSADETNRFAVKSDAVLISHDDMTPGTGNLHVIVNKAGAENTAALLFQSGYSGHGEIGLTGNDDLTFKVSSDGSAWRQSIVVDRETGKVGFPSGSDYREPLTGPRTYYVRTDGNDDNTGFVNDAGGAFLTIQHAIDTAAALDSSIYDVTIELGAGTYSAGPGLVAKAMVGAGKITIIGDTTTPGNVVLETTSANESGLTSTGVATIYDLRGVRLVGPGSGATFGLFAEKLSTILFRNVEFGAGWSQHIRAADLAIVEAQGDYSILGGAGGHWATARQGIIRAQNITITLTGTPAITLFADARYLGMMMVNGTTFTGGATGTRYRVDGNSVINTNGGGASYLPGSSAGMEATGGQYM
ncbi:MAG: DUF2793 domain-containing protein [Parvibaculum sp.]|nr:DUF2793 domain-containing protein [Parvibaculum sp.]